MVTKGKVISVNGGTYVSGATLDTSTVLPALRSHDYLPGDTVGVFASGSMARGWGNATSDVDVHVITETVHVSTIGANRPVSLEPNAIQHERTHADGRRWDIEYWTANQVDQLLDKVSWASYDSPDSPWTSLSTVELGMLERLPHAIAADDGSWLAQTKQRLLDSAHKVILIGMSLRESDGAIEDAAGQLEAGDIYCAVVAARRAFEFAVDALQANERQFGSLWPKWRPRRMMLIDSSTLSFEEYWATETMAAFDPDNPRAWVEHTVKLCQHILSNVEL